MTDREKMIEVIKSSQWGRFTKMERIEQEYLADRLIAAGFGIVTKPQTIVDILTRNLDEENRE